MEVSSQMACVNFMLLQNIIFTASTDDCKVKANGLICRCIYCLLAWLFRCYKEVP